MLNRTKGAILIPKFYKDSYLSVGRYLKLLSKLHDEFNYTIIHTDDFTDTSYDVVIVLKSPNKGALELMKGVKTLPKTTKVVLYLTDLHDQSEIVNRVINTGDTPFNISMREMCARANLILCPYKYTFLYKFGEFKHKLQFFPHFVDEELQFIPKVKQSKCLISGATCPKVYPLRTKLAANARKHPYNKDFSLLVHPGYFKKVDKNQTVGVEFLKCISGFICAVSTPSIFNYVVAKYFEIPAAGTILVAKTSPDLLELGFEDGINFIEVNDKNALDKIKHILYNRQKYEQVRLAGQELIKTRYTKSIAYAKLVSYIDNLF